MDERITPHLLKKIRGGSAPVALQFQHVAENVDHDDPLGEEEKFSPVKGLVHKYPNRVLWKVTYRCAAHCQFCTRARQIGSPEGDLVKDDIERALDYLRNHPEVDDVILSGGDPLYAPESCMQIIKGLRTIDSIKVVRIGTRLPIHAPKSIKAPRIAALLEEFRKSAGSFMTYVLVHVNHSDELDEDVIEALRILRSYNFPVLSQSVFLKDVNDNETVLETLFKKLYYLGVVPYYIYRCDYVKGLERFVCDMEDERRIMTSLRERMSGIALPTYIADVNGIGKIPVPLGFWDMTDLKYCRDYTGATIQL